jgi:hypothetical protein
MGDAEYHSILDYGQPTTQLEILYHFQCVIRSFNAYKYVYDAIWRLWKHAELGCLICFYCGRPDDNDDIVAGAGKDGC